MYINDDGITVLEPITIDLNSGKSIEAVLTDRITAICIPDNVAGENALNFKEELQQDILNALKQSAVDCSVLKINFLNEKLFTVLGLNKLDLFLDLLTETNATGKREEKLIYCKGYDGPGVESPSI